MVRLAIACAVLLAGCWRSKLGEFSGGYARDWSGHDSGYTARFAAGVGRESNNGSGPTFAVRIGEESSEVAFGLHAYQILHDDDKVGAFLRGGVNLLEWDRVGSDDNIGALGPSLQAGLVIGSVCVVGSISRDLRLFHDDDTFVGVAVGLCDIYTR